MVMRYLQGPPEQSGAWLGNSGIQQTTNFEQLYFGELLRRTYQMNFAPHSAPNARFPGATGRLVHFQTEINIR